MNPEVAEEYRPDDWISASEAIRLVRTATLSANSHIAIATRARAGLLRSRADLMIIGKTQRHADVKVPESFWWAGGEAALTQNWEIGDFETWIDRNVLIQAFGVRFHRDDLRRMVPTAIPSEPARTSEGRDPGGRPMSTLWPEWVAELVSLIHEEGMPARSKGTGVDELISRISDRLAERGLEGPSRSTVQETAKAVLRRLREAGN